MHGQHDVETPEEYIAAVDDARRDDIAALDALIRDVAPDLPRYIQIGILGYGKRKIKYADGREEDWMRIGLSSNKSYISLYVASAAAEKYAPELPKAKIGKTCIRFKRLSDLDESVLRKVIAES